MTNRWEYKVVNLDGLALGEAQLAVSEGVTEWDKGEIYEAVLNRFGHDGWQLSSLLFVPGPTFNLASEGPERTDYFLGAWLMRPASE